MAYQWVDHRVFDADEGAILFGVDHGSLFLIDAPTREVLHRWGRRPSLQLGEISEPDREILEGLREACFLVPESAGKRPLSVLPDPRSISLGTMVLEVAQDCNLRCRYCYADGGAYGGEPRLLSPDKARQAVRHLVREAGERKTATLVLFGGEPLLNIAAVKAAVEETRACAEQAGKDVHISMTTNGTLLEADIIDFLKHHRVSVAISLDGPPDLHNANRPDAAGQGSYARILPRLRELLRKSTAPVAARVTLAPDQWGRIEEVFDHLTDLGFHEVGIAPVSPVSVEFLPNEEQERALLAGFSTMALRFQEAAAEGRILPFTNILDLLGRLHMGQTKSVSCGAGLGYLAVDAAGDFFLCHRFTGEAEFHVGDLDNGTEVEKIRSSLQLLTKGHQQMCADCWARSRCAGGCYYENHLRENKLGLPPGSSCSFIRSWLQLGIELYAELQRTGSDRLLQRLERRAAC
jgi:uncharacterized protein